MIDKTFIEKIVSLDQPFVKAFHGLDYCNKEMRVVRPPSPKIFSVCSLSAILDFCAEEIDTAEKCVLHIKSHVNVILYGHINEALRSREEYIDAQAFTSEFPFGRHMDPETFIINLQASFIQDETTAQIMKLAGNITRVSEVGVKDDGVTQSVEAKVGLAKVANVTVPNPVVLRPYRTFIDIQQPASDFVLRMNANHQCALFEADGGAWKLEAMRKIKVYLDNGLKAIGRRDNITILC